MQGSRHVLMANIAPNRSGHFAVLGLARVGRGWHVQQASTGNPGNLKGKLIQQRWRSAGSHEVPAPAAWLRGFGPVRFVWRGHNPGWPVPHA